jgi:hypothetical protein
MTHNHMPVMKIEDSRHKTRRGQIRIEVWGDTKTLQVVRYNLAYINHSLHGGDNGRVLGFDDEKVYPGFSTPHHCHYFGVVYENTKFVSYDHTFERFMRHLRRLKYVHGKDY